MVSTRVLMNVLVLGGCLSLMAVNSPPIVAAEAQGLTPEFKGSTHLSASLSRRIRKDLAQRLNQPLPQVRILEATPEVWPDQCLGLARPFERCRGGAVPGWKVQLATAQQTWGYRSDRTGQQLRPEPLSGTPDMGGGNLTREASRRFLRTVSQQVNRPVPSLQILELQPATWNGCLGIYVPNQACTMIAMAGFRAIVTDAQTTWIYHLTEDGSQVAQNATASGASRRVLTTFQPVEAEPPPWESQVVFQSQISGDLAGSVQTTVLLRDGTLYRDQSRFSTGQQPPQRTLLRRLSAAEVKAFETLLETHRFPNLDRLRYLTDAAFADYPTTHLQQAGMSVEYIDLALSDLPPALRTVATRWEALVGKADQG
ncbi:hypothetical protein [Lyngbya confervoides]|uniref:Uncharacterized protein n=1 Tax=Lyngbya confervoides BDU141951 TaxID=1574623 RepID=A0ABD4T3J8_9CYAN|nr:hypothetical protein [Lyngbya confervoides]MCM1983221.1 hypothetical protein [Lyngbya confervoides BDU141951]